MVKVQGKIFIYSADASAGIIEMPDGTQHTFLRSDWISDNEPKEGDKVEFKVTGQSAKQISILDSHNK